MKKLLILFALFILACSSDDDKEEIDQEQDPFINIINNGTGAVIEITGCYFVFSLYLYQYCMQE